jgi:hypothetical protein
MAFFSADPQGMRGVQRPPAIPVAFDGSRRVQKTLYGIILNRFNVDVNAFQLAPYVCQVGYRVNGVI